jgi:hypothetical protein
MVLESLGAINEHDGNFRTVSGLQGRIFRNVDDPQRKWITLPNAIDYDLRLVTQMTAGPGVNVNSNVARH